MSEKSINGAKASDTFSTGHKFKSINSRLWEMLQASEVYFASPNDLNDPFDCQIDLMKAFRLALQSSSRQVTEAEERSWQAIATFINEQAKTCGVFSLSHGAIAGDESQLFWPHYGDCHRGICLSYCIPHSYVLDEMIGIAPVEYTMDKLFDALNNLRLQSKPPFEEVEPVITALLTTKAKAWAYEKEFRLIAFEAGLRKFPREWLVQLCFGLRVPESIKQTTIASMSEWGYKKCAFAEIYMSDTGVLDLAIKEIGS
jgi:hypothetical protein